MTSLSDSYLDPSEPHADLEDAGALAWFELPRLSPAELRFLAAVVFLFIIWIGGAASGVLRSPLQSRPPDMLAVLALSLGARRQFGAHLVLVVCLGLVAEIMLGTGGAGFLLRAVLVFFLGHFVGTVLDLRRPGLFVLGALAAVSLSWCSFAVLLPFLRQASPPDLVLLSQCIVTDWAFGLAAVGLLWLTSLVRLPRFSRSSINPQAEERLG